MSETVFAIRAEPGLSETISAGAAIGLEMSGEPLFAVEPVAWEPVDTDAIDAILVGSANVFRHGGEGLLSLVEKPVHAVGEKTAAAAEAAGFGVAAVGQGGLQALLDTLEPPLRLFRPGGEERIVLAPPKGISIEERTLYRSVPLRMSPQFARSLADGGVVLLHSASAARHFASECERLSMARDRLGIVAIGPRILPEIGAGWAWSAAAAAPNESALLALARDMCLSVPGSKNGR